MKQDLVRNQKIHGSINAGVTRQNLAFQYGLTRNRISAIYIEVEFAIKNPKLNQMLSPRERPHAAFLWSRGYKITK